MKLSPRKQQYLCSLPHRWLLHGGQWERPGSLWRGSVTRDWPFLPTSPPLVIRRHEIVGVVSFGVGCNSLSVSGDKLPGIYSRVSPSVDWIKEQISSGEFCSDPAREYQDTPITLKLHPEEETNPACGSLLKRYPDTAQAFLKCKRRKRLRDWDWITSHYELCTRSKGGFQNRKINYLRIRSWVHSVLFSLFCRLFIKV